MYVLIIRKIILKSSWLSVFILNTDMYVSDIGLVLQMQIENAGF